MSSFAARD